MNPIIDAEIIDPDAPKLEAPPEPPKEEKKEGPSNLPQTIPLGKDGRVMARDNAELMRYCGAVTLGGGVPDRFNTPQKLFAALMFVRDLRLPDTAIRQVANIHGVMNIFGDLPLAMAQRTKEITYLREVWIDKDYNPICATNKNLTAEHWGSVIYLRRGEASEENVIQEFAFTLEEAKAAGLYPDRNPAKPWNKYTKMMLHYRARAIGLKSLFADALSGVAIGEYDNHLMLETRDVTPGEEEENKERPMTLDEKLRAEEGESRN